MRVSNILKGLLTGVLVLSAVGFAWAEDNGAYSGFAPYSLFGVGDLFSGGSAYNMTMGGVGIASRNNRYLNYLNPAAVTARDSLSFMSDFSVYQNNRIIRQGSAVSASNLFNMNDFVFSFPVTRRGGAMVGIKPYSTMGYDFHYYETDPKVLAEVGNVSHNYYGQGSIYQIFAAAGVNLFKGLNLGVEYIHYTGNLEKTYEQELTDAAAIGLKDNTELILSANTLKFGLQYEQKVGSRLTLYAGAVYTMNARLGGFVNRQLTSGSMEISSSADTLTRMSSPYTLAGELGVGIGMSYNRKFRAEFDYTRSDWSECNFSDPIFTPGNRETFRFGVEYIPRPNDVRYYRNIIAYRAGAYFVRDYYKVNGNPVYARGITFGVTLPIFQWYNGVSLGVEIGQRGSLRNDMILENYINFNIGINLFDIWFQQYRYE